MYFLTVVEKSIFLIFFCSIFLISCDGSSTGSYVFQSVYVEYEYYVNIISSIVMLMKKFFDCNKLDKYVRCCVWYRMPSPQLEHVYLPTCKKIEKFSILHFLFDLTARRRRSVYFSRRVRVNQ
jgi:hypothetical protein